MALWIALLLLAILVVAFVAARYAAKSRRRKRLRERDRQRRLRPKEQTMPHSTSRRSEMRAYDDPSTFAGDITTTQRSEPGADHPDGSVSAPARPKVSAPKDTKKPSR